MDTTYKSLVLTRGDLHSKTRTLPFYIVDIEHFSDVLMEEIAKCDLVLFFEDDFKQMKFLKNRTSVCGHWSPTVSIRDDVFHG